MYCEKRQRKASVWILWLKSRETKNLTQWKIASTCIHELIRSPKIPANLFFMHNRSTFYLILCTPHPPPPPKKKIYIYIGFSKPTWKVVSSEVRRFSQLLVDQRPRNFVRNAKYSNFYFLKFIYANSDKDVSMYFRKPYNALLGVYSTYKSRGKCVIHNNRLIESCETRSYGNIISLSFT